MATAKKPAPKKKAAGRTAAPAKAKVVKAGRPSLYRREYDEQAYKLCLLGATDAKLADFFGVSEQTVNAWKTEVPTFLESITRGKEIADAEIAEALFHRAKGYSHDEEDIRTVALGAGGGSEIVKTPTVKHYPPDTQAASLWLRNRQPKLWRDKVDMEHSGVVGNVPIVSPESAQTAEEAYRRMLGGK
jgi:DNA-binding XRE family transcriptional regulator